MRQYIDKDGMLVHAAIVIGLMKPSINTCHWITDHKQDGQNEVVITSADLVRDGLPESGDYLVCRIGSGFSIENGKQFEATHEPIPHTS